MSETAEEFKNKLNQALKPFEGQINTELNREKIVQTLRDSCSHYLANGDYDLMAANVVMKDNVGNVLHARFERGVGVNSKYAKVKKK